jgi:hypothetical protein
MDEERGWVEFQKMAYALHFISKHPYPRVSSPTLRPSPARSINRCPIGGVCNVRCMTEIMSDARGDSELCGNR